MSVVILSGCYSFNGASTDGIKTVHIQLFENNAPLVVSYLSNRFTESLKERIRNQSKLNIVEGDADVSLEGNITGYDIKPIAIQDNTNPVAGQTLQSQEERLIKLVNAKLTENIFNRAFAQW